jgi:hypothetical protein
MNNLMRSIIGIEAVQKSNFNNMRRRLKIIED